MATIPVNNIIRSVAPKSLFESALSVLSSSVSYNQGDLIAFDGTNNVLKAVTGSGQADNILGVARQTIASGKVASPYSGTAVDSAQAIEDVAGPVYGIVAALKLKSGDSFTPGCKVYLTSTDAQTVSSGAAGNHIGLYQGASVTAGTASVGDILVGARYSKSDIDF